MLKNQLNKPLIVKLIACILAFVVREYLFTPIVVDSESMMPTLKDSEHIILNEVGKNNPDNIKRFDIIVFHATKEKDYIKRVIGLPDDHIEYRNDTLYINGKKYAESYLDQYKKEIATGPLTEDFKLEDYTGSKTVPSNSKLDRYAIFAFFHKTRSTYLNERTSP
ncbi:signal peptidase I [Priestia megaterium]|uniref:signal peptidase I n=1 Tax=Priestia megaterium TaxID=1404 RepID=UPI003BFA6AC6